MLSIKHTLGLCLVLGLSNASLRADATEDPTPAVDERWVWDLTTLYASQEAWEADFEKLPSMVDELASYEGRLSESSEVFLEAYERSTAMWMVLSRLWGYASRLQTTDTINPANVERSQRMGLMWSQQSPKLTWWTPELLEIGLETVERYFAEQPALAAYRHNILDAFRQAAHTLSPETEKALATISPATGTSRSVYNMLRTADIDWPEITLSTGETVTVDITTYGRLVYTENREDREAVFNAHFGVYNQHARTFATTYFDDVRANCLWAQVRDYESALQREFFSENLPEAVYRTLIEEVHNGLPALHRYFRLRGRMMGLVEQRYYDMYNPIIKRDDPYPIEKAIALFAQSTAPLGEDYNRRLQDGLSQRWMHVYPAKGKRSGAYNAGSVYDAPPFIFLNHQDDYSSTHTLAHEWGHAMHSVYSNTFQPHATARYSIFIAEIAAYVNQALLARQQIANAPDDNAKLFYLGRELDRIRGSYFRQAKFAEFELRAHEAVEAGEPLSAPRLNTMYGELLREFMGHDEGVITIDETYHVEWARIPHFYRNFYVYNYSTSMAGSMFFAERILNEEPGALEAYLDVLKAGGSDYPHEILKRAGLDLSQPEPYQAIITRMHELLDEMEAILDRQAAEGA